MLMSSSVPDDARKASTQFHVRCTPAAALAVRQAIQTTNLTLAQLLELGAQTALAQKEKI